MKKSNIIQTLNNEMMNQALADWSKGDYSLLIGAVCTFNADPFLVEYDELAQDVAEEVLQDGVTFKIFERKTCMKTDSGQREAFIDMCEKLECLDAQRIVCFYSANQAEMLLVCFAQDIEGDETPEAYEQVYSVGYSTDEYDFCKYTHLTRVKAQDLFEQLCADVHGEVYTSLADHCSGGEIWICDDVTEERIETFFVKPKED